jgi:hypothetical protein
VATGIWRKVNHWCTVWTLRAALSMPSTLAVVPSASVINGVSPSTPECTRQFDLAASTTWISVISDNTLMIEIPGMSDHDMWID